MKSLAILLLICAAVLAIAGVILCCVKKQNSKVRNQGIWLIVSSAVKAVCGFIAMSDPIFAVACLVGGLTAISAVINLLREKGDV